MIIGPNLVYGDSRAYLRDTLCYVLCGSHHQKFDHRQGIFKEVIPA